MLRILVTLISLLSLFFVVMEQILLSKHLAEITTRKSLTIDATAHRIELLRSDSIYSSDWWEKPVVIEEYNLIFFPIPKVACTEFKLLFHRMMGLPFELPANGEVHTIQNPKLNKLKTLGDYPLWKAEEMMNSPQYTKATFVREPKERILSAFLNKFAQDRSYFRNKCCSDDVLFHQSDRDRCNVMIQKKNFEYFLKRTQDCFDPHWEPQTYAIDDKWWPKIDFIGYMDSLQEDIRTLLTSLTSNKDNMTAWDKVGKEGWVSSDGIEGGFMEMNGAGHAQNAKDSMLSHYAPGTEKFVELHWKVEWQHASYHFKEFRLFEDERGASSSSQI